MPSLTGGWVSHSSAFPRQRTDFRFSVSKDFYCLILQDCPSWKANSPCLYPAGKAGPVISPDNAFLFDLPPTLRDTVQEFKHSTMRGCFSGTTSKKLKLNSVLCVRERTIPTKRPPLLGGLSAKFADRGCHVVSVTDPYGRILGFLDRFLYFSFHVAPQLYSRG
jgi:hypothetical protein